MRFKLGLIISSFYMGLASQAYATPKNIIIIRHAEKIPGKNHLDLKGYERAAALAYYFSGTPQYNTPPITHVFAMGLVDTDSSVRPIETCTPIASHLKLKLNIDYNTTQLDEMAREILTNKKYDGTNILVCMDHVKIAKLSVALGAEDPGFWPPDVFDQVYMLSYENGPKPKLEKILQKLMFGDRASFDASEPALPPHTSKRVDED